MKLSDAGINEVVGVKLDFTGSISDLTDVGSTGVSAMPSNSDAMGSILVTGPEIIVFVGVGDLEEVVLLYCLVVVSELDAGIFLYSIFVMTSVITFVL